MAKTTKRCTCASCGFQWEQGKDGSHSCSAHLRERLVESEVQNVTIMWWLHRHQAVMQAALLECYKASNKDGGAKKALVWLENTLAGPGLLPPEKTPLTPQEWFDFAMEDEPVDRDKLRQKVREQLFNT